MKKNIFVGTIFSMMTLALLGCSLKKSESENINEQEQYDVEESGLKKQNIDPMLLKTLSTYPLSKIEQENPNIEGPIFQTQEKSSLYVSYHGNSEKIVHNALEKLIMYNYLGVYEEMAPLYLIGASKGKYKNSDFSITNRYPITPGLKNILEAFDRLTFEEIKDKVSMFVSFNQGNLYPEDRVNVKINDWNVDGIIRGFDVAPHKELFLIYYYPNKSDKNHPKNMYILISGENYSKTIAFTENFKSFIEFKYFYFNKIAINTDYFIKQK